MNETQTPARAVSVTVDFAGRLGPVMGLTLKLLILNIVTLTIYRFWGRTEVRRYLWGHTTLNGEALEYLGRGRELFFGFLLAVVVVILPIVAIGFAAQLLLPAGSPQQIGVFVGIALLTFYLTGVGVFQAWRYQLSRTSWRGVRFGLTGSAWGYGLAYILLSFLNLLTLGLLTPVVDLALVRRIAAHAWFGSERFRFEARPGQLYPSFLLAFVVGIGFFGGLGAVATFLLPGLGLPDLGDGTEPPDPTMLLTYAPVLVAGYVVAILGVLFVTAIYAARSLSVMVGGLRLDGLALKLDTGVLSFLWLNLGNIVIMILTLGFGQPIAQFRTFRYVFSRLRADGTLDVERILQSPRRGPAVGEGLAEIFGTV